MLNGRIERLTAGDVEGYLSPLDPQAQQTERPIAEGAAGVPLVGLEFKVEQGSLQQGDDLRNVQVALNFRYSGLPDDNLFRVALNYDLVRGKDDSWRVTSSTLRAGALLPIWATGPIQTQRSQNFLALYRPGLANPGRVMQEAEQARAQLDGKITFPLEKGYLLLIASDEQQYATMSSAALTPVSPIAQVETSYEVTPYSIKVLSRQMVVNNSKLQTDGSALETFRHELGHLAVAQYTRPFTPAWVSESAAMYLAGTRPVALWRDGLPKGKFDRISIEELTKASNLGEYNSSREGASLEYAYSAAAAWYLVETFSAQQYWTFYRAYADVPPAELYDLLPDPSSSARGEQAIEDLAVSRTAAGLQKVFALDPVTLDRNVKEWMSAQR